MSGVFEPMLYERAAMWLHGKRYAESGQSATDFYKWLPEHERYLVRRMARDIIGAATAAQIAQYRKRPGAERRQITKQPAR